MGDTEMDVGGMDKYLPGKYDGKPYVVKEYHNRGCKDELKALETEVRNIEALRECGIDVPVPVAIDKRRKRVSFPYAGEPLSFLRDPFLAQAGTQRAGNGRDMERISAEVLGQLARIHSLDTDKVSSTVCLGNTLASEDYILPTILGIIRGNDSYFYRQMMEAGLAYDETLSLAMGVWREAICPLTTCKINMCHAETVFVADDGKVTLHDYVDSRRDQPLHEVHYVIAWGIGDDPAIASRMKRARVVNHYLPRLHRAPAGFPSDVETILGAIDCCAITEAVNTTDVVLDAIIGKDHREYTLEKWKVILHLAYQNLRSPMSSRPDIRELVEMLSEPLAAVLRNQGIDV
jgi:hypothetical protein